MNNIDNIIYENHDTYIYYSKNILDSEHRINLSPVYNDPDNVYYSSYETELYNNGIIEGFFKVNRFAREVNSINTSILTFIGTIVTPKGNLIINYAGETNKNDNLYVLNQDFISNATYKGGEYNKYLNVKVSINVSNNDYRVMTISY